MRRGDAPAKEASARGHRRQRSAIVNFILLSLNLCCSHPTFPHLGLSLSKVSHLRFFSRLLVILLCMILYLLAYLADTRLVRETVVSVVCLSTIYY